MGDLQGKIWFVYLNQTRQGPFAALDLLDLPGFSPDTLVWREGMHEWEAARHLKELEFLFVDSGDTPPTWDSDSDKEGASSSWGGAAVMKMEPNQFIFWFVIIILIITYLLYRQNI